MRPTFPFRSVPPVRLQPLHGRLLCRISLPAWRAASHVPFREVVIVAAPTAPHLRYLMVYRQPVADEPPRAA